MAKLSKVNDKRRAGHNLSKGSQEPGGKALSRLQATLKRKERAVAGLFCSADRGITHPKLHPLT